MYNHWEIVDTVYKSLVIYVFNVFYYCVLGSRAVYFPCLTRGFFINWLISQFFCECVL